MAEKSNNLTEWLEQELHIRGWSIRELARRAELAASTVTDVINGKAKPGFQFCVSVARALHVAPVDVLRRAGLLPSLPEEIHEREELLHYFTALPADDRQRIVILARALHEQRAKYETED